MDLRGSLLRRAVIVLYLPLVRGIWIVSLLAGLTTSSLAQKEVQVPRISEEASPPQVISAISKDGEQAIAVLRKPPGSGPFPAVIFLHGGLDQATVENLRNQSLRGATQSRFLAAGYATVTATFRSRREDPQTPKALWDCIAISDTVKQIAEIDSPSVVVVGGSGGGSLALELAGETDLAAIAAGEPATVLFTGMFTREIGQLRASGSERARSIMDDPHHHYTPERRRMTQEKIARIRCPVYIAHGDVHPLKKLNFEIFIPELFRAGKRVQVSTFPGEPHGFYWARTGSADAARRFFDECHFFFKQYLKTLPVALDPSIVRYAGGNEGR